MPVVVHLPENDRLSQEDLAGAVFSYAIGPGGTLVILKTESGTSLASSKVWCTYAPHAWESAEGTVFGDLSLSELGTKD